jgi:co-chaperonin GroES (HSP10)
MKERMIRKTSLGGQYVQSSYEGKNTSGIEPVGDSCLVLIDESVEKTAGGITLPETMQERLKMAAETGVLVAVGGGAFVRSADRASAFAGRRPQPGDRVYFTRYAGIQVIGRDDQKEYRLMTDNCIGGIEPPEEEAKKKESKR